MKWGADCLLASGSHLHCVPWFMSPCVHVRERALPVRWGHDESGVLLAGPVTATHCFTCFAFCLKKKRCFTGINSHWVSHSVTACVSIYVCTFTFLHVKGIYIYFFLKLCLQAYTRRCYFLRESQRVKSSLCHSLQLWSQWQDVPTSWCMLNSPCCTLYLPVILRALYTWLILHRRQHFWTDLVTVPLGASLHSCIQHTGIFCSRDCFSWFVCSACATCSICTTAQSWLEGQRSTPRCGRAEN